MIRNQWYVVLESKEIPAARPVGAMRLGEKMVFWRDSSGRPACLVDRCPHRGAALSAGKLVGDHLQCPFHGFEFDASGACRLVPANGRSAAVPRALHAQSYPLREAHGFIYLWWGDEQAAYPPPPFFDNIAPGLAYATLRDHWPTHYSRAIENQLDMAHLPFVHHNTIGSGKRTVVNGPITSHEHLPAGGDLINVWIANSQDTGQKALKPSEMPAPTGHPLLQFLFPNLWQNWLGDDFRLVVAFVPVDEANTLMYVRNYHTLRLPVLRQVMGVFSRIGNQVILNQDRRVVITQRPLRSDEEMDELLIPADGPIILYRKLRRALIERAAGG